MGISLDLGVEEGLRASSLFPSPLGGKGVEKPARRLAQPRSPKSRGVPSFDFLDRRR